MASGSQRGKRKETFCCKLPTACHAYWASTEAGPDKQGDQVHVTRYHYSAIDRRLVAVAGALAMDGALAVFYIIAALVLFHIATGAAWEYPTGSDFTVRDSGLGPAGAGASCPPSGVHQSDYDPYYKKIRRPVVFATLFFTSIPFPLSACSTALLLCEKIGIFLRLCTCRLGNTKTYCMTGMKVKAMPRS